jgi:hypothetical protein
MLVGRYAYPNSIALVVPQIRDITYKKLDHAFIL